MVGGSLPVPEEPQSEKLKARTYLATSPKEGLVWLNESSWLVDVLWPSWGPALNERGIQREQFREIAQGYANETRLWVMGERTWEHCVEGLIGRISRRSKPTVPPTTGDSSPPLSEQTTEGGWR